MFSAVFAVFGFPPVLPTAASNKWVVLGLLLLAYWHTIRAWYWLKVAC